MTRIEFVFDSTRIAGMAAFGASALVCVSAATSSRMRRPSIWWVLAAAQLLCLVEIVFAFRYRLHGAFNALLQDHGLYGSRERWQASLLIAVLAASAGLAGVLCWRHRADRAAVLAIVGATLGLLALAAEAISLHRIDTLMYAPLGPLAGVVWMWIAAAVLVTGAALDASLR